MRPPTTKPPPVQRLFLVEDDEVLRGIVADEFVLRGWHVTSVSSCRQARELFVADEYDAVISDLSLPDGDAFDLLDLFRARDRSVPVLVLTGHGTIDLAVRAMRAGASQFLTKPVDLQALVLMLGLLIQESARHRPRADRGPGPVLSLYDPFLGSSPVILNLKEEALRVAAADGPILVTGETGVGKGVLAAWLHTHSRRSAGPFLDLNCAGLSRESLESDLFGHERGAFTGAVAVKPGLLEIADGGTVFLDEIGDTDLEIQARLLKVIEEKRFRRMGDVRLRTVDVRIIAATHQDLRARMAEGKFRADLYFRVSTLPLRIPPLREREQDLPMLIDFMLPEVAREAERSGLQLAAPARQDLIGYPWPGNIRELRNVLVRAALMARGNEIHRDDLLFDSEVPPILDSGNLTLQDLERLHIARVLEEEGGHVERTAKRLGISRSNLYEILRRNRSRAIAD